MRDSDNGSGTSPTSSAFSVGKRVQSLVLTSLIAMMSFACSSPAPAQAYRQCRAPTMDCPFVASLMNQREGYGGKAKGGLNGVFVVVTSSADSGPGTLSAAIDEGGGRPVWIVFDKDMTIQQSSQYRIPSNVTIDGRGHQVTLLDYGLGIYKVHDVIVTHLTIDGESKTFSQAFNIANFTSNIWADHLDLSRFNDRLIDVKDGATDTTLSWIKFHDDNKVMLLNNLTQTNMFANYDRDSNNRVTMHHCYFLNTVQRNPRAQVGIFHIYNNLLENWDFYGMSFSMEARATVEGNMFLNTSNRPCNEPAAFATIEGKDANYCRGIAVAPTRAILENGSSDKKKYDATNAQFHYTRDWRAFLKVRDNYFGGEATAGSFADYQPEKVPTPPYCYSYDHPDQTLIARIRREAGNTPYDPAPPHLTCANGR